MYNMTIQVTTDHNITGGERLSEHIKDLLNTSLQRFSEHISKVIVHLSDENGAKKGPDDLRCVIEAHYTGIQPVAAVSHATTSEQAVKGAIDKLKSSLDTIVSKLKSHH